MRTLALALVMIAAPLWAAEVKVPAEVKIAAGVPDQIKAVSDSKEPIRWVCVYDKADFRLLSFEAGRNVMVWSRKPGKYTLAAFSQAGGEEAYCVVTVEGVVPPVPPDPKPPDPPDPKPPTPAGPMRVLIVHETAKTPTLPQAQQAIIYGMPFRGVLKDRCDKMGPDGRGFNIWDQNVAAEGANKFWRDALGRARPSVPYIHIWKGDVLAYEGVLPPDVAAATALINKYAGG